MADDDFLPKLLEAGSDPLVRTWLKEHHDTFKAGLAGRRADWDRLALEFTAAGYRNREGGDVKREGLRKLWRIVQAEVAAERAAKPVRPKPAPQAEHPAPAITTVAPVKPKPQSETVPSRSVKFPDTI